MPTKPIRTARWVDTPDQHTSIIETEIAKQYKEGGYVPVRTAELAKRIIQKYKLKDKPDSLRRVLDKAMEAMPQVRKYRGTQRATW